LWGILDSGDPLPDHVGEDNMLRSCWSWIDFDLDILAKGQPPALLRVPLGAGLRTIPIPQHDWGLWPIPLEHSGYSLAVVVRQWVEETPNPHIGRAIADLPAWREALNHLAWIVNDRNQRAAGSLWGDRQRRVAPFGGYVGCLRRYGLPATPGTVRWMLHQLFPDLVEETPGPTRGLLIQSFGLVPQVPSQSVLPVEMSTSVAGAGTWCTSGLQAESTRAAARHLAWWKQHAPIVGIAPEPRRGGGRPPDELAILVQRCRQGCMEREEVYERAFDRKREMLDRALTPMEKQKEKRAVDERFRKAERAER
jgi:hypothetical protein